jgi:hypothetical protein
MNRHINFADYLPNPLQHLCNPKDAEKSDFIYGLACQYNLKERAVRELCAIAEIDYPPKQMENANV